MNNKCEWKDLKVDKLPEDILTGGYEFEYDADFWIKSNEEVLEILRKIQLPSFYYRYRKPEEKPLIVKSGGTYVAHFEDVDYLLKYDPIDFYEATENEKIIMFKEDLKVNGRWKPFSEITLTDEIAKLRPMVIDYYSIEILLGIHDGFIFCYGDGESYTAILDDQYKLATAHELQEVK